MSTTPQQPHSSAWVTFSYASFAASMAAVVTFAALRMMIAENQSVVMLPGRGIYDALLLSEL